MNDTAFLSNFTSHVKPLTIPRLLMNLFGGDPATALLFNSLLGWLDGMDTNGDNGIAKSTSELQSDTGLGTRYLKRAIDRLQRVEFGIKVKRGVSSQHGGSTVYWFFVDVTALSKALRTRHETSLITDLLEDEIHNGNNPKVRSRLEIHPLTKQHNGVLQVVPKDSRPFAERSEAKEKDKNSKIIQDARARTCVMAWELAAEHWDTDLKQWDDDRYVWVGWTHDALGFSTSVFRNPYQGETNMSGEEQVDQYRKFVIQRDTLITRIENELGGKTLVCNCEQESCHAEVLAEIANRKLAEYYTHPKSDIVHLVHDGNLVCGRTVKELVLTSTGTATCKQCVRSNRMDIKTYNPWHDTIKAVFDVYGSINNHVFTLLFGIATAGEWAAHKLDEPATQEEIRSFGAWYKREYEGREMVRKPEKIESEFLRFRDVGNKSPEPTRPEHKPIPVEEPCEEDSTAAQAVIDEYRQQQKGKES